MPHFRFSRRFGRCFSPSVVSLSAAALAVCFSAVARAQSDGAGTLPLKGPLPARDPEPLITPFLQPTPTDASVLNSHHSRFAFDLDIVNNLLTISDPAKNRSYNVDFEEQRLSLGWARGLARGQEIGIRTVLVARNGGILDNFINDFHKTFGFKGGGRADLPNHRVLFQVNAADGRSIVNETRDTANGIGDTVIEYRRQLTAPTEANLHTVATSVRALVKLPTGNYHERFGSGAADAALGLAATWRPNRRFAVHGNVSEVFLGDAKITHLDNHRTGTQSVVAAEYLFDGRTSLVLQSDDAPAPFDAGIDYADRPRRAFTFGFWHQVSGKDRYYLSLSENDFGPFAKYAPDFVLSMGMRRGL